MVKCPKCGKEYTNIGMHWNCSPSHRPELTRKQKEIVTGLLMGDGCINNSGKNFHMQVDMISPNYLEYLDNLFGCLGCGVRLKRTAAESAKQNRNNGLSSGAKEENYSDLYRWNTRVHPLFNEFRQWYSSGEKVWPKDIELTPTVLKHWYVGDGYYDNKYTQNRIVISISNEVENTDKISKYFNDSNLPVPSNYAVSERKDGSKKCDARWTVEDSYKLWDYMGEPLPDFEYKWPEEYR